MDIAALSIIKNQVQLYQNVNMAVMKKAIGTAEQQSNLVNEMLGKTVPNLGKNLDVYI
jgi:hypothetical protein